MLTRILLDPQGGEGNGGENAGTGGGGNGDLSLVAAGLIAKSGDAAKVVEELLRENHGYREKNRTLKGRLPGEDAVVLRGDDAKRYKLYQSLGDDPKAIGEALQAGRAAIDERDGLIRERDYSRAARLGGMKEGPFKRLAASEKLNVVIKDEMKNGKEVEAAYVIDDKGKEIPLADYAEAHWGDFRESLGLAEPKRKVGMPGRASDNTPPPRPGSGSTEDLARAAYLRSIGRTGL